MGDTREYLEAMVNAGEMDPEEAGMMSADIIDPDTRATRLIFGRRSRRKVRGPIVHEGVWYDRELAGAMQVRWRKQGLAVVLKKRTVRADCATVTCFVVVARRKLNG